ncbi:MAG: hypothetical protein V1800_03740, partial [Candidatus Latescibacterota bacterium]
EHVKREEAVHQAKTDDLRFAELSAGDTGWENGEETDWEDANEADWNEENEEAEEQKEGIPRVCRPSKSGESLRSYLTAHTKTELIGVLEELAQQHPDVRKALQDRRDLASGDTAHLVRGVLSEIDRVSCEPEWSDGWAAAEDGPDYSGLRKRLERLLSTGHADEILSLGKKLLEAGTEQAERSHDGGESAYEIAKCMEVVFRALPQSSMSAADQMLWAIDAELSDDYDFCGDTAIFWKKRRNRETWSTVADGLARRLSGLESEGQECEDFDCSYLRDGLSDRMIHALSQAGRDDEVIPLCEREAPLTGSYNRLVDALMEAKRWEEAAQWALRGIEATSASLPGIATDLRDRLRKLSEMSGDVYRAAAFRADEFFEHPNLGGFLELTQAARKAKVGPAVRTCAMRFLETGMRPEQTGPKANEAPEWPLPQTGVSAIGRIWKAQVPMTSVLIDIALSEKNPEEALRWHDLAHQDRMGWIGYDHDRLAQAVLKTHPERALEIWKKLAESQIAQVKPSSYELAAGYLRKAQTVFQRLGQEDAWKEYLAWVRKTHRRKRRLLEILDRLDGRRIIDT